MYIEYKKSYLSDGTKVKITYELFNQFKKWEVRGIEIDDNFKDELKIQDNQWLNSYRGYYRKFTSFGLIEDKDVKELIADDKQNEMHIIKEVLRECTGLQRDRFIKHYIHGYDCIEISRQERKNQRTIQYSINKTKSKIYTALQKE